MENADRLNEGGRRENLPSALQCFVLPTYGVDFGAALLGSGGVTTATGVLTVDAELLLLGVDGVTVNVGALLPDAAVLSGCPSVPSTCRDMLGCVVMARR